MNAVSVDPVFLPGGIDGLNILEKFLSDISGRFWVLTDTHTVSECLPLIESKIPRLKSVLTVPCGEQSKQVEVCVQLWTSLMEQHATRDDVLICLGGGVVTDLGAFIASTYKRGIRYIHIPTSLLAMADAATGGKNGIDLAGNKNMIGLITFPEQILIWPDFLHTLPSREFRNGYAEVIKHALIADEILWMQVSSSTVKPSNTTDIIKRAVAIKSTIIREDPYEKGPRRKLNFGHTVGHAIESWHLNHGTDVLHGEAVAAGMIIETYLSLKAGLKNEHVKSICEFIAEYYGTSLPLVPPLDELMPYISRDKKNNADSIRFSLLTKPGDCIYDFKVAEQDIEAAIIKANLPAVQRTAI